MTQEGNMTVLATLKAKHILAYTDARGPITFLESHSIIEWTENWISKQCVPTFQPETWQPATVSLRRRYPFSLCLRASYRTVVPLTSVRAWSWPSWTHTPMNLEEDKTKKKRLVMFPCNYHSDTCGGDIFPVVPLSRCKFLLQSWSILTWLSNGGPEKKNIWVGCVYMSVFAQAAHFKLIGLWTNQVRCDWAKDQLVEKISDLGCLCKCSLGCTKCQSSRRTIVLFFYPLFSPISWYPIISSYYLVSSLQLSYGLGRDVGRKPCVLRNTTQPSRTAS
jgi:hypothetical protein